MWNNRRRGRLEGWVQPPPQPGAQVLIHTLTPCPLKTALSLQASDPGVPGSPGMHRPWELHTAGCPRATQRPVLPRAEAAHQSLPGSAKLPRLHAYPWGTHSTPEKLGTRAWQTTSNAALGLPVSLRWLKLLLASALAFNFSTLNNHLDLPTVVLLAGVQRARNKAVQGLFPRPRPGD